MKLYRLIKIPFIIVRDIFKMFLIYMPGTAGIRLRRAYYKKIFKECGCNLIVDVGVTIDGAELIRVGDNVFIDKYCVIATGKELTGKIKRKVNKDFLFDEGEIVIGSNVHLAQFCILMGYGGISFNSEVVLSSGSKVYSLTNTAYDLNERDRVVSIMPYESANFLLSPVVLNRNVWLGLNSIVMPGVVVGRDSFCVSNALLSHSFGENAYISGQPAEKIRDRFVKKQ